MRIRRVAAYGFVVVGLLYIAACHMIDNWMEAADDPRLMRGNTETETDWTLSYLSKGPDDGHRLIYVHGTPGSAQAFERYLLNPIEGFESISIDRPGFGKTIPREPALRLEEQSRVIEPLLVEREGQYPILVGHSLGAPHHLPGGG